MAKTYVYQLKHKYKKHPELLASLGFLPYQAEDEEEKIYAVAIELPLESSVVKYIISAFEKVYEKSDNKEDFSEYTFSKNGKLKLTKKVKNEFTRCQLCFADGGVGAYTLFINAPDRIEYYSSVVLDECVKNTIDILLKNRIVYKKKIRYEK